MNSAKLSNTVLTTVGLVAAALSTFLMLRITIPYLSLQIDAGFLVTKQSIIHVTYWRYAFYTHVCTSIFLIPIGTLQFIDKSAYRFKAIHRIVGIAYISIIVLLSGPSGFIMGYFANGGIWAKISFMVLSVCWICTTAISYFQIRRGKIAAHKKYMIRSYALTLSAITLRTYALVLPKFIHLHGKDEYVLMAWLSWVPNLILAEVVIKWFIKPEICDPILKNHE